MKKIVALLLALASLFVLCACGSKPEQTIQAAEITPTPAPEVETKEVVLVDDENVVCKIVSTDPTASMGYTLNVYCENKGNENALFTMDNVSVNGFMCDPFWATRVPAGKKANSQIVFMKQVLEKNGITNVNEIEFTLLVMPQDGREDTFDYENPICSKQFKLNIS